MAERISVEERIARRIEIVDLGYSTPCHIWRAYCNADGYGEIKVDGVKLKVHRVTYALYVGDLIPGMHVDHLCRNRACCNPEHLEQVTPQENVRRGDAAILTVETVGVIKARLLDGEPIAALSRSYGVSASAITSIRDERVWLDVAPAFHLLVA